MQTEIQRTANPNGRDVRRDRDPRLRRGSVSCLVRPVCCLLACGLLATTARVSPAQSGTVVNIRNEYNVKAAYLYGFGRYIEWRGDTFQKNKDLFTIGVLGEDPFNGALDTIAGTKKIQGRAILIRRWKSLDQYRPCHILFVPRTTDAAQRTAAIRALRTEEVLLVGETPNFAQQGGTVGFRLDQQTVRFDINIDAAKRKRLAIDAPLLKLARIVKED